MKKTHNKKGNIAWPVTLFFKELDLIQQVTLIAWFVLTTIISTLPGSGNISFAKGIGIALLNGLSLLLILGYLLKNKSAIMKSRRFLMLIVSVSIAVLVSAWSWGINSPLLIPIAAAAMIYSIVCGDQIVAFLLVLHSSCFCSLIIGGTTNEAYFYFLLYVFTASCAVFSSRKIIERANIMTAGVWTAVGSVATLWALALIGGSLGETQLIRQSLILLGMAFVSVILVLGILPYLEMIFNIVTPIRLLELSNPNTPLLKRLAMEAPGTYHHSLMVANLAEAAIEATSGDPLLARVAGYYHDIGKIKRPYFFIENQSVYGNPHDQINPRMSAMIILAHTKEGVELGREYGLPRPILHLIEQHHGTSIISYFYRSFLEEIAKAEDSAKESLTADDFRYPGPKPQTREAAAIMLADSCEAAVRAMEKPNSTKISTLITKIVREKVDTGELDDCIFTFQELTKIKNTYINMLTGMAHVRIKYQQQEAESDISK